MENLKRYAKSGMTPSEVKNDIKEDIYCVLEAETGNQSKAEAILNDFDAVYENIKTEEELFDYFTSQV
jgi:hypothetical protein